MAASVKSMEVLLSKLSAVATFVVYPASMLSYALYVPEHPPNKGMPSK